MRFWDGEKYREITCTVEAKQLLESGLAPALMEPAGDSCVLCRGDILHLHGVVPGEGKLSPLFPPELLAMPEPVAPPEKPSSKPPAPPKATKPEK